MAFIWFLAQMPTIIPITQLIKDAAAPTSRKAGRFTCSSGMPLTKSTRTFTAFVSRNGSAMLPIKYCHPVTEDVISTRSVCFSFSSAIAVPTITKPSPQIFVEIPRHKSIAINGGDSSPPVFWPYNSLHPYTSATVRMGPSIIIVFRLMQIHFILATAANFVTLSI